MLEAQWSPVKHLILGEDPQLRVYAEVSVWYKKIELFRKGEDERMFHQDPTPEDLAVHKSLVQRLLADGEYLLSLVRLIGLPENIEGIKPEDVIATIETLHDTYRGWHDRCPKTRRHTSSKKSSQMSRNPLIEAIHEARYNLETCAAHEQAACRKRLDALISKAGQARPNRACLNATLPQQCHGALVFKSRRAGGGLGVGGGIRLQDCA